MGHFHSRNHLISKCSRKSLETSTTTKYSSQFRYFNGRRFHNNENSIYFLPNDNEEVDRLQLQHFLFRYIWKSNFSAPINDLLDQGSANVLDVG
ncbi:16597_t:CDS:2, partial [Funneliformis mosseae]